MGDLISACALPQQQPPPAAPPLSNAGAAADSKLAATSRSNSSNSSSSSSSISTTNTTTVPPSPQPSAPLGAPCAAFTGTAGSGVRLAIIVPYRNQPEQNRERQLHRFAAFMPSFLAAVRPPLESFHIIVVEQSDDGFKFNRGKALNVGMSIALRDAASAAAEAGIPLSARAPFNALCLHDVDLLPSPALAQYYSVSPQVPVHIAAAWPRYSYDTYVGGILTLSPTAARATNGFPNNYWGWGGEDDELYRRLKLCKLLPVSRPGPDCAGAIIDLEEEFIASHGGERAGTSLRNGGREAWRNMLKHELTAAAADSWRSNGLRSCSDARVLRSRQLNADTTVVTVDLNGAADKWAQQV